MTVRIDKVKSFAWRLTKKALIVLGALVLTVVLLALYAWQTLVEPRWSEFGTKSDEAKRAGLTREQLAAADTEYFVKMDKGWLIKPGNPGESKEGQESIRRVANLIGRSEEEVRRSAVRGQNGWIAWTGGNDWFWDYAANNTGGAFDLLKVVSSYKDKDPAKSMYYGRRNRWRYLGLVNEPCFVEAREEDFPKDQKPSIENRFRLRLDKRDKSQPGCEADDPFADEKKYRGAEVDARGKTVPVGSYYGEPSGIIGLRLFPNPAFDKKAEESWDAEKYYTDPEYYNNPELVRPYRVGMSCAFCHVGPNPINPPEDPENPKWENLTSNPGAQYYWVDRIFFWNTRPRDNLTNAPTFNEGNFLYQLFHTNPPGSLDTSLVSTDYMNNPRTMNAVYDTLERLGIARITGREQLKDGELNNKQFGEYPLTTALSDFWDQRTGRIHTMRVLKDGSDSVGALGALNRVYLNIGLFGEEWILHFRPFVGGRKITPIKIEDAQKNSVYWQATEDMTPDMAMFFLTTARADKLKDAPKGADHLKEIGSDVVARGKIVFAENCAACHSSKLPKAPQNSGIDSADCDGGGNGPNYRQCWDRYWQWAQTDAFRKEMVEIVKQDDFLEGNYLSNERRVPLDLLQVNACGLLASNALRGDIWDNFSSDSYKSLPPPLETTIYHPESGAASPLRMKRGNGRGYLRPASLISLWSTAPYLSNNSVGHEDYRYDYEYDYAPRCPSDNVKDPYLPCVENRLYQFDRSIHEMLYPERRRKDPFANLPGYMYRTSAPSCLSLDGRNFPPLLQKISGLLHWLAPWAIDETGGLALGPLPKGFPINALLNTKLLPDNDETEMLDHLIKLGKATPTLLRAFKEFGGACKPEQLADPGTQYKSENVVRETRLIDTLVGISKCPDFVVNRGHYFGAGLPEADKEAMIEYLKHF